MDNVSGGMVKAVQSPDLKGTVDVVNTGRFYPLELDAADNLFLALPKGAPEFAAQNAFLRKSTGNKPFRYRGAQSSFYSRAMPWLAASPTSW